MNEIFSVVSGARAEARAWGSVTLTGKCCSRRHSTTSFSESVACELQTFLLARLHLSFCDLLSFVCHSLSLSRKRSSSRNVPQRRWARRNFCHSQASESVVMAETSYQLLEVLEFCNRERAQPPPITITVLTFLVKKVQWRIRGCLSFDNTRKNFKSNLVLVVVLVLESKGR